VERQPLPHRAKLRLSTPVILPNFKQNHFCSLNQQIDLLWLYLQSVMSTMQEYLPNGDITNLRVFCAWFRRKKNYERYSSFFLDLNTYLYGLVPHPSYLKLLEPIQSASLCLATSAFRTSPSFSLCAESAIPSPPLLAALGTYSYKLFTSVSLHPECFFPKALFLKLYNPSTTQLEALYHNFKLHCLPLISPLRPQGTPLPPGHPRSVSCQRWPQPSIFSVPTSVRW